MSLLELLGDILGNQRKCKTENQFSNYTIISSLHYGTQTQELVCIRTLNITLFFPVLSCKQTGFISQTHSKMLHVGLVHTRATDTPFPFSTAGAICPREVLRLAHQ